MFDVGCKFKIVAEGVEICQSADAIAAAACLISAYFVFNNVYPDPIKLTMLFIQHSLFEIVEDGQIFPKSVLGLMQRVNSVG